MNGWIKGCVTSVLFLFLLFARTIANADPLLLKYSLVDVLLTQVFPNGEFRVRTGAQGLQEIKYGKAKTGADLGGLMTAQAPDLVVDPTASEHPIWGYGAAITESCLSLLNQGSREQRNEVMRLLFNPETGAGFRLLRVPIGGHDFSDGDYSLDDMPAGEEDPLLQNMNFKSLDSAVALIKEVQALKTDPRLILTPWTPPAWMKDTQQLRGGQLKRKHFGRFADYLMKAMDYLQQQGLPVDYITAQNEPLIEESKLHWFYPQAYMSLENQFIFAKNYLLPRLRIYGFARRESPELLLHDHNWGNAMPTINYFESILEDVRRGLGGVAMHCYSGDLNDQLEIHQRWPKLSTLNSECTANIFSKTPDFDFQWWMQNQVMDSTQAGSRGALGWNLCLDEKGGPHNGGCDNCRGLLTLNQQTKSIELNPEYYALAQVSRFARKGAVVVQHQLRGDTALRALTFVNPDQSLVVVVRNPERTATTLIIALGDGATPRSITVPPSSAITLRFYPN